MTPVERVAARRAIEALRAGVPNSDAVTALGCNQPEIERRFLVELDALKQQGSSAGFVVEGGFGAGKSHLFVHLQRLALARNFVCSRVVVSKETPLHDPLAVFRNACESAVVPGRRGSAVHEIAIRLDFQSDRYRSLQEWANSSRSELDARFPASLFLYQRVQSDPELLDRIVRFWSGEKISIADFKRFLRLSGGAQAYRIVPATARQLAPDHFAFMSQLIRAGGHEGWVVLIDEVELIARYPLKSRARAYAEISRWTGRSRHEAYSGIAAVLALTDDFRTAVLDEKGDARTLADRIRGQESDESADLASGAERGMQVIEEGGIPLKPPSDALWAATEAQVRKLHGVAFDWVPPQLESVPKMQSARIRQLIKSWITQWDLLRLDPTGQVDLQTERLNPDYSEDEEL